MSLKQSYTGLRRRKSGLWGKLSKKLFGDFGVNPPKIPAVLASAAYVAIASVYNVYPNYTGPMIQCCAVGAALAPPVLVDIYAGPDGVSPNYAPAIAAFGNTFEIHKYLTQNQNGNDLTTVDAARRHRVIVTESNGGITYDIAGNFYKLPDSVSVDRQALSFAQVVAEKGVQVVGMVTASYGNTGATQPVASFGSSVGLQASSTSTRNYRRAPLTRMFYKAVAAGAVNTRFWRNNDSGLAVSNGTLGVAGAIPGGALTATRNGNAVLTVQSTSKTVHWFTAFMSGEMSQADGDLLRDACLKIFPINLVYDKLLVYIGDSIGHGQGCSDAHNFVHYLEGLIPGTVAITNPSTPARRLAQIQPTIADFVALKENTKTNYALIQAATNDFGQTTDSATTVFTNYFTPILNALKTASFRVAVETVPARQDTAWVADPQKEIERLAYNQMLKDNAVAMGYTVIDRAANPDTQDPTNAAFFVNDKLHFLSALYQSCAVYEAPAINAWLLT